MAAPKPVVVVKHGAGAVTHRHPRPRTASASSDEPQRMLLRARLGVPRRRPAAEAEEEGDKVVAFKAPRPMQMPRIRVNWRRTLAASLVVSLLEGVAFATAYWYVVPTETGSLLVETTPAGIEILVDGRVMGRTPFSDSMTPGRHTIELRQGANSRVLPVEISSGVQTMQRITWAKGLKTGQARVTATAPNAHVTIDGKKWGKAPLTISTLAAGKHMVQIESDAGTVSTPIAVSPGETTELDVPIYPGWVSVLAPVQLFIFEGERFLGTTEGEKLMLSPGKHTLDVLSEELGYRRTLEVTIVPGATAAVSLPMPKVAVTIDGPEGADLIVDGEAMGKLPLTGVQVPLGTRDFVVKHPDHGEKRQVVTVTQHGPDARQHALTLRRSSQSLREASGTHARRRPFTPLPAALYPPSRPRLAHNCTIPADRWYAWDRSHPIACDRVSMARMDRPCQIPRARASIPSRRRWSLSHCPNTTIARLSV